MTTQSDELNRLALECRWAWNSYNAVPPEHADAPELLKKWAATRRALVEAQGRAV